MNLKVFLVIGLTFATVFGEEILECNDESKVKMDRYMMEMTTFGDPNGKYPTNSQELVDQCRVERQKSSWCTQYTDKCLHGISKELMQVSLRDLDRTLNKYCDSPRLSKLFISWSQCGNKALNDTVKCWQNYVLALEQMNVEKERIPFIDKTPLICCSYHLMDHCIEEALISRGKDICPEQSVSGLHSLLDEIAGKTLDIFCGDYAADNDKCDAIHKKYIHLKEIKFEKAINKSPLNPFVDIVDNAGIVVDWKSDNDQSQGNDHTLGNQ